MTDDRKGRTVKKERNKEISGGGVLGRFQNTFGAVISACCYTETELDRGHRGMNLGTQTCCRTEILSFIKASVHPHLEKDVCSHLTLDVFTQCS